MRQIISVCVFYNVVVTPKQYNISYANTSEMNFRWQVRRRLENKRIQSKESSLPTGVINRHIYFDRMLFQGFSRRPMDASFYVFTNRIQKYWKEVYLNGCQKNNRARGNGPLRNVPVTIGTVGLLAFLWLSYRTDLEYVISTCDM